jgi:hypothetical protein
MPTAENAKLEFEAGQTLHAMAALTNSGNQKKFTTAASLLSKYAGKTPLILPNGLITGGAVIPAVSVTNNLVDVAALTCYLAGVNTSVAADTDVSCTRGVTNGYRINSITVNSSGVIAVVAGTESTAFSETRAAAGGPPLIPTTSIEIAQVRFTTTAAAAVTSDEIFATVGTHLERWDYPNWSELPESGTVDFLTALPLIHTGTVAKSIYGRVYAPIFAEVPNASDFVPPENSHTINSTQVYGNTIASSSASLGQGSFNALMNDGVTDPLVTNKDKVLWFRFYPDRNKTPYVLCQGKLGIGRTYPAGNSIAAACTISAEKTSVDTAV